MRQVPQYLLIGNGRLAVHFRHYFSLLGLSFDCWHRQESPELLQAKSLQATHIFLLISDCAIEAFIERHLSHVSAKLMHCSGSLFSEKAYGVHPLMTFSQTLYDEVQYREIPFVTDADVTLPGLPNPFFRIQPEQKAKYHALCVLANNFSTILWQKLFRDFEQELSLPGSVAHSLLKQQTQNLCKDYTSALTGPLVRNDQQTLQRNIGALAGDPFQSIYQAFINVYPRIKETQA